MINIPKLLITHDGIFHADELFTIALIQFAFGVDIPYKRTRKVTNEELEDPDVWVLDQYGQMNIALHNFDHHQNINLPATNVLVLQYLFISGLISSDLNELLTKPFNSISDYDRKGPLDFNGFQVNELIRNFNSLENGFDIALTFCKEWLRGIDKLLLGKLEAQQIYKNGFVIGDIVRVCSKYPMLWPSMGKTRILVAPEKDQWRVHSSDTKNYPILSTGKEIFIHENKFISVYSTKEDAIVAATLSAKITPLEQLIGH